ncbi:MAG: TRAP transporter small permease subunit [Ideonella sp.]|nr:TRAP transporter small permease subunit [Ideonella sp.]
MDGLFDASGRIAQALAVLTKLLLATVVVLVSADVAARNFARPLAWSVSLTEYLLVYITFLSMPALVRGKGHVCADFIRGALPGKLAPRHRDRRLCAVHCDLPLPGLGCVR